MHANMLDSDDKDAEGKKRREQKGLLKSRVACHLIAGAGMLFVVRGGWWWEKWLQGRGERRRKREG